MPCRCLLHGLLFLQVFVPSLARISINGVTPQSGSIAGGTTISLYGSGFSTDAYTGSNLVFIGTIPCAVIDYTAASNRLQCVTSPYPDAVEGASSPPLPISILVVGSYYTSSYTFTYAWWNTPEMYGVVPRSGPLYSLIQMVGYKFPDDVYNSYDRFFVGDGVCGIRDQVTNQLYSSTVWVGSLYLISCLMTVAQVGGVNATALTTNMGASWNNSQSLYPGPDWGLVMYEIYPDIQNVYPNQGGSLGGTLLTIEGSGFGINQDDLEVDIDGIPCSIVSFSQSAITCTTGRPPDGSPALSNANLSYPSVQSGYRFKGSRGVNIRQYLNIAGGSLNDLYSSPKYPGSPDYFGIFPSFESPKNSRYTNYGETYTAFFTPHNTGTHTFLAAGDDNVAVNFTASSNISQLKQVETANYANSYWGGYSSPWRDYFNTYGRVPMELSANQSYLLRGVLKEAYGLDYLRVGVLIHNTSYTYSQTKQSQREEQSITLSTSGLYDIQTLYLSINTTQVVGTSASLVVSWGQRTSDPVPVSKLTQNGDALKAAIFGLFYGICYYRNAPVTFYNNTVYGFEYGIGSNETWQNWGVGVPVIVDNEAFCGRFSLYVQQGQALAFDYPSTSPFVVSVTRYPYLCLAYKLPPGNPMSIAIDIQGYGWRSINMIRSSGTYQVLANFQDFSSPDVIADDGQWHFVCTDLGSMLRQNLNRTITAYTILGLGFYSAPDPTMRGFYVDEVSFSSVHRTLANYTPPARPNGIALHTLNMNYGSHANDNGTLNITLGMEVVPATCESDIPLMNVSVMDDTTDVVLTFSLARTQVASVPLGGLFSIGFEGQETILLPYNSNQSTITSALQSLATVGGVTVWPSTSLPPGDLLGKWCSGRTWYVRFETIPGDLPLMTVDPTNLTGDGLGVKVAETVTGGLFLRPIPGHMLQTAEVTPQVHVRVKGQLAGCSGGMGQYEVYRSPQDPCGYTYSASLNPLVTSIAPTNGSAGTPIQISGAGFNASAEDVTVLFGSVQCSVTTVTYNSIQCTLGEDYAGAKPMSLSLIPLGIADTQGIELQYSLAISSVVPSVGSMAGGTTIVISGSGFAPSSPSSSSSCITQVLIGGQQCDIIDAMPSQVTCMTPPTMAAASFDVSVNVTCNGSNGLVADLPSGYAYDAARTPAITGISVAQGSGAGGDAITIYGSDLMGSGSTTVLLGGVPCSVTNISSSSITCVTPPHPNGTVDVSVVVGGLGRASGGLQYSYMLQVVSISQCSGSIFGGQTLDISGGAFTTDPAAVQVAMGTIPCVVQSVLPDKITCTTSASTQTHAINNNAHNPQYGLGYQWNPDYLIIQAGDTVQWSWTGSPFAATRNVAQVDGPGDTEYNGNGFQSAAAITGSFSQTFTVPGTYYYIAEGYATIGFNGTIVVVGLESQSYPILVSVNGASINLNDGSVLCGDTASPYQNYTFAVSYTPTVTVTPSQGSVGMLVEVSAQSLSSVREDNTLTFGGMPCSDPSSPVSAVKTTPTFASVDDATRTYSSLVFNCTLPGIDPGEYEVSLHVEGRGWAYASVNTSVISVSAQITTATTPPSGSLRGGQEISIPVHGLTDWVVGNMTVTIGNTPCQVQRVDTNGALDGILTCITSPARDDGYSSLVSQDGAQAYWSLQTDIYAPDGTYHARDGTYNFSSRGLLGSQASASVFGRVLGQQVGISGNNVTDQAAEFNSSYIKVPALNQLTSVTGFGIELWLGTSAGGRAYRIVVDASTSSPSGGYMLVLNPCNQLEFWLGIGPSSNGGLDNCPLLQSNSPCPASCSGITMVTAGSLLPSGKWSVIQSSQSDWSPWHQVFFGWSATVCDGTGVCTGDQVLYVDGSLVNTSVISYVPSTKPITFGGSSRYPAGGQWDGVSQLAPFVGLLDEISFYGAPLSPGAVAEHYHYGSSGAQPIWLVTEEVDGVGGVQGGGGRGQGFAHLLPINWENQLNGQYLVNGSTVLLFQWTSIHGLSQVSQAVYQSCDLGATPIKQWASGRMGGAVTVELAEGSTYYFIDPVLTNCALGHKAQVQVGNVHTINWYVTTYNDITVAEGTGLLFQWNGPFVHSVVEMASQSAVDSCLFVGPQAAALGQVVKEWSPVSISGNAAAIGLTPGDHYFVCSVPGHCTRGMRLTVTVLPGNGSLSTQDQTAASNQEYIIPWRVQQYGPVTIIQGESLVFAWDDFHSLHQVTQDVFKSCNTAAAPLVIWSDPSVGNSVSIMGLQPGTYYFLCSVSGHCDAGMKVRVTVLPNDGLPIITRPRLAECGIVGGYCEFSYKGEETPVLLSVEPSQSTPGSILTLYGTALVPATTPANTVLSSTVVWVGKAPCTPVTLVSTTGTVQTLQCTIPNYESGVYYVDVLVDGVGYASLSSTPLAPGPLRNTTHPAAPNSPYPVLTVMGVASSITPSAGSIAGGTVVLIGGSGFSQMPSHLSVTIGGTQCSITSSSVASIACITGPVVTGNQNYSVSISVKGLPISSSIQYGYLSNLTPQVSSVSPNSGLMEGMTLQITGSKFDSNSSNVQVYIVTNLSALSLPSGTNSLCSITTATTSTIVCVTPPLAAGSYKVVVYIAGKGLSMETSSGTSVVSYKLAVAGFSPQSSGNGGGVTVTIDGIGFPASSSDALADGLRVLVCSIPCVVAQSSLSQITCTLGPNSVASPQTTNMNCPLMVSYGAQTSNSSSQFSFVGALTPVLYSISPSVGGTAGGTMVTIMGEGLLPPDGLTTSSSDIVVTIDGSVCQWFEGGLVPTNSSILCRTSAHLGTTGNASVTVLVRDKGQTVYGSGPVLYKYYDRWSSKFTWGGASPPREGESVYIQAGQTVVLDTSTPVLNLILIEGFLIFEDSQDIHLQAKYIFINGGGLQVGTEQSPFMHNAVITLYGTVTDPEIPIYGAKVLGIRQGTLDLHGRPRNITWTRLAQTAQNGTDTIYLQEPVDWVPGDIVVIAATGKDGNETEVQTIVQVSPGGLQLTFNDTLEYTHQGVTEIFEDGQFIDIRAEVGLLTHNVVVEGSRLGNLTGFEGLGADQYGSQVFIHRSGMAALPVRIDHTEFRYGGQAFRLGRYAIHFHLCGSMNGSYIKHCSIHHSNNRAITAHGVHDLILQGNVAYDIKGHTYFVEDGIETNNYYIGNLGVLTRGSSSLLTSDQIPAVFWITNPKNFHFGNAAAASRAYGFWYELQDHPTGASYTTTVCPNKMPFGGFANNTAHTCNEFGLRIWETYIPYVDGCGKTIQDNATFYNFTSYSNGIHGLELSVVGQIRLSGFKVADNVANGIEIQETRGVWGGAMIMNTLIVSHTSVNTDPPGTGGIKTPNTPHLIVSNVTFVNFDSSFTSCLRACSHCKLFQGGFQVWLEKLKFLGGSENRKTSYQWEHEVLYRDMDGTLTGFPGGWATPSSGLHPPQYCNESVPAYSLDTSYPGAVCTSDVHFLRMAWNQASPLTTLKGVDVNVTNQFGLSIVPWRHYRLTHMDGYMTTLPSGYDHTIVWRLPPQQRVDTTFYNTGIYGLIPSDRLWITHDFVMLPDHVEIGTVGVWNSIQYIDVGSFPLQQDQLYAWHIDNVTSSVTYLITGVNNTQSYYDLLYTYGYFVCPRAGCPVYVPPVVVLESAQRRWSSNSSWPSGRLPREGENVNISAQWRMLMDVPNPPAFANVYIMGQLQFEDARDYNFTANRIIVLGSNAALIIGTQQSPFQHNLQITLTGLTTDKPMALNNEVIIGSKAIGVFGNVSIFGVPSSMTWTHLGTSAHSGDHTITLQGTTYPNWTIGDQIVIAPSGWEPAESEIRTVVGYDSTTGVITLDQPLQYDHLIYSFLTPSDLASSGNISTSWWGDGGSMAPEVGLLTHNVVIQGGNDPTQPQEWNYYGCRLLVGTYSDGISTFSGPVQIDSVEFRFCGQGGYFSPADPRYSIAFLDNFDDSIGSFIHGCSIHHGYNTAIGIHTSNGVEVSQNVIWRTTDSSLKVGGVWNNITGNLAIFTSAVQPNQPLDNHAVDFPATFDVDGGNILRDNAAGGSTRLSYRYDGEPCISDLYPVMYSSAMFWNNTAHTGLVGLNVLGTSSPCTSIGGFTSAFHWNYGVFSSVASSLVVTNMRIATGKVGMNLNVYGPDPVQHLLGGKFVQISNSLIVGNLPGEQCFSSAPSYAVVFIGPDEPKLGIMMTSFNQKRSKMDGTGVWHLMKGYPVIDGVLKMNNNTFARFFNNCAYSTYAIGNNPESPDAVPPINIIGTTKLNVQLTSLAFFYNPNPAWVNQEDCIDMDCDGPKHALVRDLDGTFVGTYPVEGSVVPLAEIRFINYVNRLPVTWLAYEGGGQTLATWQQVIQYEGVARGSPSNFNSTFGGCTFMPSWNAYRCQRLQHFMFVFESMDADTETRRLSPIALHGGNTGAGNYTDMINGPMDHGWCSYYTCLKRLSTFFTIVAKGADYYIWSTGSLPQVMRFHLLNSAPSDGIRVDIWFKDPLRKDVYRNGIFIESTNVQYLANGGITQLSGNYVPQLSSSSGSNYFDRQTMILHMIVRGSDPIQIQTPPVVQVSLTLAVSIDDFFVQNLISNLAYVLKINPSTIRVVQIIAESAPFTGKRSLLAVNDTSLTLELGAPPPNTTAVPVTPSVDAQLATSGGQRSVDVVSNVLTDNITSSIPLNNDPPFNISDFINLYNASVQAFNLQVGQYNTQLKALQQVYTLGDQLVNLIQTQTLPSNVTMGAPISKFTVTATAVPNGPVMPSLPAQYQYASALYGITPATLPQPPATLFTQPGQTVSYTVPSVLVVTQEPSATTGYLVYVVLVLEDSQGNVVTNLGLTTTWTCTASLHYGGNTNSAPVLEGITTVPLVNGKANFTKLRVSMPADQLSLSFVVQNFEVTTSVQFSVVAPPPSTPQRHVSFLLTGDVRGVSSLSSAAIMLSITTALSSELNVDISRLVNVAVMVTSSGLMVSMDILDRQPTDPPPEPGLLDTLAALSTSNISVTIGSSVFTLDESSLEISGAFTPSADYTLITAISATFGAAILLGVTLTILIMVWSRHRQNSKSMKIHVHANDKHLTSEKATKQFVSKAGDHSGYDSDVQVQHIVVSSGKPGLSAIRSPHVPDYMDNEDSQDTAGQTRSPAKLERIKPVSLAQLGNSSPSRPLLPAAAQNPSMSKSRAAKRS